MSALAVFSPRRFGRLLASDALSVGRDPVLLLAIVMSAAPAIAFHLWHGKLDAAALEAFGIAGFARYVAPLVLLLPAALLGWVAGFLMLEDRDDGPLLAIDVTPVGKEGMLAYRVTVPAAAILVFTLFAAELVVPESDFGTRLVLSGLAAAASVLATAVLPAVARNKVEGLAITKITNIAGLAPLLAIIPSPWRYAGGIVPTYWMGEVLRLSPESFLSLPWILTLAAISHLAAGTCLFVLLRRRAG